MRFITDKIKWTEAMKNYAEEETEKKLKNVIDNYKDIQFKVSKVDHDAMKVDINIDSYRVQCVKEDFYDALLEAISKLKSIINKDKKRQALSKQISIYDLNIIEDENVLQSLNISKEKVFNLSPLSLEEAITRIEKTDYSFYVFKDIDENDTITILYKRYDNSYGLIRCK